MPNTNYQLFSSKVIQDILTKLKFLTIIDNEASDTLQVEVRGILEKTQNTPESFMTAYKEISITTCRIFYEKLNELRTLNAFDETIEQKQKNIEAYAQVVQEILTEMTIYACEKGIILATQDEIKARLNILKPNIIQTANLAAANSTAALFMRPVWLALTTLGIISNPVTSTALAGIFFAAEIYKTTHEFFDLETKEPTTYLGMSRKLWSNYSTLLEKEKILRLNEALISSASQKNPYNSIF